jgi:hypothetical protein
MRLYRIFTVQVGYGARDLKNHHIDSPYLPIIRIRLDELSTPGIRYLSFPTFKCPLQLFVIYYIAWLAFHRLA